MPKTVIEKSPSPSSDVTVFSVSGTLGFHEKDTLEKLFEECKKRSIDRVVFDLSALTSLGGGCAKIIQEAVATGDIALGIVGAKPTVLKFLKDARQLVITDTVDDAVAGLSGDKPARQEPAVTDGGEAVIAGPEPVQPSQTVQPAEPAQPSQTVEPAQPSQTVENPVPKAEAPEALPNLRLRYQATPGNCRSGLFNTIRCSR